MPHKFKIGQMLLFYPAASRGVQEMRGRYVVTRVLPQTNGEFHYQIRNQDDESIEHTAMEGELRIPFTGFAKPGK
jgi:hypothetical protein